MFLFLCKSEQGKRTTHKKMHSHQTYKAKILQLPSLISQQIYSRTQFLPLITLKPPNFETFITKIHLSDCAF